jgi:hypothetical protein
MVLIIIPLVLTAMFRDPMVQSLSARMLTKWLTENTGYDIALERVRITAFNGIEFHGFKVDDHRGEIMLHIDHLKAQPIFAEWSLMLLKFRSISIDGAHFRFARYAEDDYYNLIMLLDKYSGIGEKSVGTGSGDFKIKSSNLKLTNSIFHLYDEQMEFDNGVAMDYSDMLIDSIYLYSKHFSLINDSLSIGIDSLFAHEKSGYRIDRMSADFGISNTNLKGHNVLLESNNSFLDIDLDFDYTSYQSYGYFLDSVMMTGIIRPSTIDMSTIGYFAEIMFQMPNTLGVSGDIAGTVSDLKGNDLRIKYAADTRFHGNAQIEGLPDFFSSYMEAEIFELSTTACDLRSFHLPTEEKNVDMTNLVECDEVFSAKGNFKGYYKDFNTDLRLSSHEGVVDADIAFAQIENDTIYFNAKLKGDTVDIGRLLDVPLFGRVSMNVDVSGNGHSLDDIMIAGDGFFKSIDFMDYRYNLVGVKGWYQNDSLNAHIRIGDKNLMMNADVALKLNETPLLNVQAGVKYANLENLQLVKAFNLSFISDLNLQMKGFDPNSMTGQINLDSTIMYFNGKKYWMHHAILLKNRDENGLDFMELYTDYADAKMTGNYQLTEFSINLVRLFDHYYNVQDLDNGNDSIAAQYASIEIELKKSNLIEEQIIPGLYIEPGTTLKTDFNFGSNNMSAMLKSEKIEYRDVKLDQNIFKVETKLNRLTFNYHLDNLIFKDSTPDDPTVFGVDDFNLSGSAGSDSIDYRITWNNQDITLKNSAFVDGYMTYNNEMSKFIINESKVYVNDTLWQVEQGNSIVLDEAGTHFNNVNIRGGQSLMKISGKFPNQDKDSLLIEFKDWKLSHFDIITNAFRFDLNGKINGVLNISRIYDNLNFVSDLTINDFYFNKEYLGTASLINTWNNANKSVYFDSEILRRGDSGEGRVFSAKGYYYPFRDEDAFDLKIDFNRLKLKAVEPFLNEFISNIEGVASGNLNLKGTPDRPLLTGMVDMKRAALVVNYLNTKYSFSNAIILEPDRINFDELVIYDTLGNFANIDGYLKHDHFKNSVFDVRLSTDKLLFFNTTRKMNDLYYGSAITSGNLFVTGSLNDIKLEMDVSTLEGTNVSLPLDYSMEFSDKDYIVFVSPESDTILINYGENAVLEPDPADEELAYEIGLQMNVNPAASVTIFIPNDLGRIESRGSGNLSLEFNSLGDFKMVGDYSVEKGFFNFNLANLVNKRFELVKGGRISWSGDPYDANLNIRGLYRVKTNLASLGIVVDSTTDFKNRVNVEAYVILTNRLIDPEIRFEIKIPELDPDLRRAVFAQIDTSNVAMLNQQVISLLVLGSFSASNAANVNLSSAYYSVITNQLSKVLSRISDDVDVGINYKPGDQVSQEEFELALSTQLFDDRLSIEGNVGMTYDKSQRNASNIVGDVDVSYKITEDGRWVLKVYNHSNVNSWYNYSTYDKTSPYTQGIGVAYTKQFNSINEIFQRTRPKKKDKINAEATKNDDEKL